MSESGLGLEDLPVISLKDLGINLEAEIEPRPSDDLVESYKVIARSLGLRPKNIYYPCCGGDTSPSMAFPDSRVIYVDLDEKVVVAMQKGGYEIYQASAVDYVPEVAPDLLVLMNPEIKTESMRRTLRSGGYLFCSDYHGVATDTRSDERFELIGIVKRDEGDIFSLNREHPERYWDREDRNVDAVVVFRKK